MLNTTSLSVVCLCVCGGWNEIWHCMWVYENRNAQEKQGILFATTQLGCRDRHLKREPEVGGQDMGVSIWAVSCSMGWGVAKIIDAFRAPIQSVLTQYVFPLLASNTHMQMTHTRTPPGPPISVQLISPLGNKKIWTLTTLLLWNTSVRQQS